ncbi:WD repeat-containing protein 54 isoform X2 [Lingula anatina]|uniref:WD repeat-containing protein 54 isoform X1 n=1 Tax=Lingula anatina TaxID=7574 RepID=A0A1S3I5B0_LINAN|nr:WD repeat-containing protein 54 isoform X1 [Lingula anatina]XP_013393022.1 WD repeat-containing protein 54 isoform X2 [Lingula anatina]|eukprot:XP_013393021.1 WD repeat-containing protein 54 isoform X1 [Lingula anatina]
MFVKDKPLTLRGSSSLLYNNLAVLKNPEKGITSYGVCHKSLVNIVSCGMSGATNHRQVICHKDASSQSSTVVMQAKWVKLSTRTVLLLTTQRGVQMFEPDGSAMLYWHALPDISAEDLQACFVRGVAGAETEDLATICVGNHKGDILVFEIPPKGINVSLLEVLQGHSSAICDLASDGELDGRVFSSDDSGAIVMWKAGEPFQQMLKISGAGSPCCSLAVWKNMVVGGYGSGHLRLYNTDTGNLAAEVTAHARWINAVDVAKNTGLLLSVSEDSFIRIWQLKEGNSPEISFVFGEAVTDLQLVGGCFNNDDGISFVTTGYDNNDIVMFKQA